MYSAVGWNSYFEDADKFLILLFVLIIMLLLPCRNVTSPPAEMLAQTQLHPWISREKGPEGVKPTAGRKWV